MANTYNLNTLYDQFNIHPETGGLVAYNNQSNTFYDDASATQDSDPWLQYQTIYDTAIGNQIPSTHIPTFDQWYESSYGSGKSSQGKSQNNIRDVITQGGYGREGKETRSMRLAKKGMELRDFLNE